MRYITVALLLVSYNALAGDLSARVAAGNKAIATPEGKAYDAALAPTIQSAMLACVPPSSSPEGSTGKFALVGYADASGHLSQIAVEPVTPVSRCFAERFGASQLPVPPSSSHWGNAYPVTVEMTITP
jgi:hypothetical protein